MTHEWTCGFSLCGPRAARKELSWEPSRASPFITGNLSRNLLHFSPSFVLPSIYPIAPGDIEVFKGMPLTSLNLWNCRKLTGVSGLAGVW